ncbi:hypothetical protein SUGI_0194430 [Cryptomeria japonica]|uniref:protein NODULATION SIGNALING PATHWAY 1 n=1 Tax=Cryptomeria japonica TaxID=3369 RepID=UPI002408CF9F|nr:protein NODULATION SIGNALING PATHWAY 1 [Cryptomeria japonica]GLJ12602.1 hypothetical protein SUGI_0194430 [Cryptomeria japonica]
MGERGEFGYLMEWLDIGDECSSMDPFQLVDVDGSHDASLWESAAAALPTMGMIPEPHFLMEPSLSSNDSPCLTGHWGDAEDNSFRADPIKNDIEDLAKAGKKRKRGKHSANANNSALDQPTSGKLPNVLENNVNSPHTGESIHQDAHLYSSPETTKLGARYGAESDNQMDIDSASKKCNNGGGSNNNNNKGKLGGQQNGSPNPSKDSRWAEQLLNPCAVAIASNNIYRIQHLIWVLHDLASASGDANHRLAAHGLKALTAKITHSGSIFPCSEFLSADPKLFFKALLKFHEVSPWFQLIYKIVNGALLEAFEDRTSGTLHVIDIGVSHGMQWPTFIEAVAQRPSGPPSLLKLTVVSDTLGAPFSAGPPSNDFANRLNLFAKTLNLNMELNVVAQPLESLTKEVLGVKDDEALAICLQFRGHQLLQEGLDKSDGKGDQLTSLSPRDKFIQFVRSLNPLLFVLSENDVDHSSPDFLERFQKSVDHLWRFLDSTSACFKGRECEERRVVEGEAAMALVNNAAYDDASRVERNEIHAKWGKRIMEREFVSDMPSDEILEGARIMLRKHDSNWEMRLDEGCVSLCWKNNPVTFCSMWKL